jgi:hypothetical protein
VKAQRAVLEKQIAAQKKLISAAGSPTPVQGTAAPKKLISAAGSPTAAPKN